MASETSTAPGGGVGWGPSAAAAGLAHQEAAEADALVKRGGAVAGIAEQDEGVAAPLAPLVGLQPLLDRDQQPDGVPLAGRGLDPLFAAVVEAAEEAVLNSMLTAPTTVGRDGNVSESLHSPAVLALLEESR